MTNQTSEQKEFPVLFDGKAAKAFPNCPKTVPWRMLLSHERQAIHNHDQTLKRLAERGGLHPSEMMAVLEDRPWERMEVKDSVEQLIKFVEEWEVSSLHLPKTKLALAAWDALMPEWEGVDTNEKFAVIVAKETQALIELRHAFYEETKDRNSRSQASAVGPDPWLRALVHKYGG